MSRWLRHQSVGAIGRLRRRSAQRPTLGLSPLHRRLRFEPLEDRRLLANVTVGNTTDVVNGTTTSIAALIATPGSDGISLREAILAANANADAATIDFSVTGTIQLTNVGHVGEIAITKSLTINGPAASMLTIRGFAGTAAVRDGARIFNVDDGAATFKTISMSGLTLSGGDINSAGGAILNVSENLSLADCTISGNSSLTGGAIRNTGGNMSVSGCTISGNTTLGNGAGIESLGGSLNVSQSTISGNSVTAGGFGAGISSSSYTVTIDSSTISGNSANIGGGVYHGGGATATMTITGSTISTNTARTNGGGVFGNGNVVVRHSTITGNRADSDGNATGNGGGVFVLSGATTIDHTIVAGNLRGTGTTRDDVSNSIAASFSLIGDNTGATITDNGGNQIGTGAAPINPLLGLLADNGGPTMTHALITGSPALDAGDPAMLAGVGNAPLNDQRGATFSRVVDGDGSAGARIDVGAFEQQFALPQNVLVVSTLADENDGDFSPEDLSLREAIELANASAIIDTIEFAESLTSKRPASILLSAGELSVRSELSINGPGAELLTISGGLSGHRVFHVYDFRDFMVPLLNVIIRGLTITQGQAPLAVANLGGGILNLENLRVENCFIMGNSAVNGGGICNSGAAALTVVGSRLVGNSAVQGAGIYNSDLAQLSVIGSTIELNVAQGAVTTDGGSALYNRGNATIKESSVNSNFGIGERGPIANFANATLAIEDCIISGNAQNSLVGGVDNRGTMTLRNTTVANNNSQGGLTGGVSHEAGSATLVNCTISGNAASGVGGVTNGGTMTMQNCTVSGNSGPSFVGGVSNHGTLKLQNCTVSGNQGNDGGGVYNGFNAGPLTIENCTIILNRATSGVGGVRHEGQADITMHNTIVVVNFVGAGSVRSDTSEIFPFSSISSNNLVGVHSNFGGAANSLVNGVNGNQVGVTNPLLGPLANNGGATLTHALLPGSPAIDAGSNAAIPPDALDVDGDGMTTTEQIPFDQRGVGFSRIAGQRVDIGAIELQSSVPVLLGDYNQNGVVDAADYVTWRDALGTSVAPPFTGADGDGDGIVDPDDHGVWRAHFGQVAPPPAAGSATSEVLSVQIHELRADAPPVRNIVADYVDESIIQIPVETIFAPAQTDTVAARLASFAALEARPYWQDSATRSRGNIHRYQLDESGGDNLPLLLAIDRVRRSPRQDSIVNDRSGNGEHRADNYDSETELDKPLVEALVVW